MAANLEFWSGLAVSAQKLNPMKAIIMFACLTALGITCANGSQVGMASVDYGVMTRFDSRNYHGMVATGGRYSGTKMAIAHRTLPLNSCVEVKFHGKTAKAIVNDRGPCFSDYCRRTAPARVRNRILDMTPNLARKLNFPGLGMVEIKETRCD